MEKLINELEKVSKIINISPTKELYKKRAVIYNKLEKFDLAMNDYENIIKLDSNDYSAYYERACEWYNWKIYYLDELPKRKEIEYNTIEYLKKSINLKETSKGYYRIAEIYFNLLDDNEKSLEYCNKALSIEDNENYKIEELRLQGQIYNEIGKYNKSIQVFSDILNKVKDEDAFIFRGIAHCNLASDIGDVEESRKEYINALSDFQNVILLDKDNVFCYMRMEQILKEVFDEVESVVKCYTRVISLEPWNKEANEYMANYFFDNGNYIKAVQCIENIGELDSDLAYLDRLKAESYYELGKYNKALIIYNKILDEKKDKYIYDYRGDVYLKLGEYDKAILDYKKFIKYYPESGGAHYRLGQAYMQKGDKRNALKMLNKALKLLPENKKIIDLIDKINS